MSCMQMEEERNRQSEQVKFQVGWAGWTCVGREQESHGSWGRCRAKWTRVALACCNTMGASRE